MSNPLGIINNLLALNSVQIWWYVTRAAGLVAYLLLWLSTASGIGGFFQDFRPISPAQLHLRFSPIHFTAGDWVPGSPSYCPALRSLPAIFCVADTGPIHVHLPAVVGRYWWDRFIPDLVGDSHILYPAEDWGNARFG